MTTKDELRDQVADLETRLSSMVSNRDLIIRDLRAEMRLVIGKLETVKNFIGAERFDLAVQIIDEVIDFLR
jgi:hypothetical protein